jgi:hypothetical protein
VPAETTDEEVRQFLQSIVDEANASANQVVRFLDDYAAHLESLGCAVDEVLEYVRLERRTLASLYFLARGPAPSPMQLRLLALRLALDARAPLDRPLCHFAWKRTAEGWVIYEYPSVAHRVFPLPPPGGKHPVRNPFINTVLNWVLPEPPDLLPLRGAIEKVFGRVPSEADTLEAADTPSFTYKILDRSAAPKVCLWVNDQVVQLPKSADVHKLLILFCKRLDMRAGGRRLERDYGIANASKAAKEVREALEQVHPGAREWLKTSPIHWGEGHTPMPVPPAARDAGDNS